MDKFGKLKFILLAMVVWTISRASGFFLNDIYAILTSRAIFGMTTAFIMTGASALLGDYYSRGGFNRRENALSLQGFFCAVGEGCYFFYCEICFELFLTLSFFWYMDLEF